MLLCAADERSEPNRIRSHLCHPPGAAVGHLHEEGNEVELVIVLPFIEMGIDFRGMLVEQFGVQQLLGSRAFSALLEEIVNIRIVLPPWLLAARLALLWGRLLMHGTKLLTSFQFSKRKSIFARVPIN